MEPELSVRNRFGGSSAHSVEGKVEEEDVSAPSPKTTELTSSKGGSFNPLQFLTELFESYREACKNIIEYFFL
jgi:hypothetical protein